MLFEPYTDELKVINNIHKFNTSEYTLLRLTETMIEKNNTDTNQLFRQLLKTYGIIDYDTLPNGGNNGIRFDVTLLTSNSEFKTSMKFYRASKRGDPRFSISRIKELVSQQLLSVGSLLYFTVSKKCNRPHIVLINVSSFNPHNSLLESTFGVDILTDSFSRLLPLMKSIAQGGWHPNSKGTGKIDNKDAGDTLEHLLGHTINNKRDADFEGIIEIKTKSNLKTLNTLFTLRPSFEDTPVALLEPNDRSRVSAFARLHGYESDKRPHMKSLYITIGSEKYPQNRQGFFLYINEENEVVELRKNEDGKRSTLEAYFTFESLKSSLLRKHQNTLWIRAKSKMDEGLGYFKYTDAMLMRQPQFTTFLSLIETGDVTYDWRGYTTPTGKYTGKNHGNAWRIEPKHTAKLFGESQIVNLLD